MTLGAHSKIAFSSFAGSEIKKRVAKESLKRQCGAKLAGAEAIVHAFQQAIVQNPDFDAFSADAVKALYSLSRDVARQKLKEVAPQAINFFMDKRSNSANAFFFGLAKPLPRWRTIKSPVHNRRKT